MIRAILFDLDGTILDTNELIIRSFLHTFDGITEQPVTRERLIPHMGGALSDQMRHFSGLEEVGDLITKYRAFNIQKHDELVELFPYVGETLQALHDAGIKLGVVTSKIRLTTEMGLKLTDIFKYFDVLITIDDVAEPKPDPEGIVLAMQKLGTSPTETMMVGDSHFDLEAGKRAGVQSVGVAWSLKGADYLKQFNPTYLIDDIRELLPLVGIQEQS